MSRQATALKPRQSHAKGSGEKKELSESPGTVHYRSNLEQHTGGQANGNPRLVGIGALPTIASCDRSAAVGVVYEPETSDWAAT